MILLKYKKKILTFIKEKWITPKLLSKSLMISGTPGCGKSVLFNNLLLNLAKNKKSFLSFYDSTLPSNINDIVSHSHQIYFLFYDLKDYKDSSHSIEIKDILNNTNFFKNTVLKKWTDDEMEIFVHLWEKLIKNVTDYEEFINECCNGSLTVNGTEVMNKFWLESKSFWQSIRFLLNEGYLKENADIGLKNINENIKIIVSSRNSTYNWEQIIIKEALMSLYETRVDGYICAENSHPNERLINNNIKYILVSHDSRDILNLKGLRDYQHPVMHHFLPRALPHAHVFNSLQPGSFLLCAKDLKVIDKSFQHYTYPLVKPMIIDKNYYHRFLNTKESRIINLSLSLDMKLIKKNGLTEKKIKI